MTHFYLCIHILRVVLLYGINILKYICNKINILNVLNKMMNKKTSNLNLY